MPSTTTTGSEYSRKTERVHNQPVTGAALEIRAAPFLQKTRRPERCHRRAVDHTHRLPTPIGPNFLDVAEDHTATWGTR